MDALNKSLILFLAVITFTLFSCVTRPAFAPDYSSMPTDPYGSSIIVRHKNPPKKNIIQTEGELIAVDYDTLIILTNEYISGNKALSGKNKIVKIDKNNLRSFMLHYAKINGGRGYMFSAGLIPLHGFYLVLTLPINLIMILTTDGSEANYYSLTGKRINFDQLYKFARFPQGLPEGLVLNDLQPRQN